MKKALYFIVPVMICLLVGFLSSQLQSDSIENWYPYLNKPPLTPPDIAFPIVWNILYVCMGISIGFILLSRSVIRGSYLVWLFAIQLVLNFLWSFFFFYMRNPLLGLMDIILLLIAIIYYAYRSYPVSKVSSYLFIPYIIWVAFATYLNLYILMHNPRPI